jgi:nuclear pore complex protein Nup107
MRLSAARLLASKVPSSEISLIKTGKIIGKSVDLKGLEMDGEDEDLTEVIGESTENKYLLKKHLLAEARSFKELEAFTEFLDFMESATSTFDLLHE